MQAKAISRILGLLLMLLSITFIPPLIVDFLYERSHAWTFLLSFVVSLSVGWLLWFFVRGHKHPFRTHEGFLIVVLFWSLASLVGTLPFFFLNDPIISFTDALFESVSGITTTGASIFVHLDELPHSILYYRQQLQFLGGISIVLLAVAILPTLGVGGMQLFRTEITGPVKDDKFTPHIKHTAKAIWLVYVLMTVVCAFCYYFAGMTAFDAIGHSFGTVSSGGFSTHDHSIGYFANPAIKCIGIVFMFLSVVNFHLHYLVFKQKRIKTYFENAEFSYFIKFLGIIFILTWFALRFSDELESTFGALLDVLFQVVSYCTTTGYAVMDIHLPPVIPLLLLFCGILGGCAGSTSGGVKTMRVLLLQKLGHREILRLIHPRGQYIIKLGENPVGVRVIEAIWGFFAAYVVVFTALLLLLLIFEHDFFTTYTALIVTFSNIGLGLGGVSHDFASLTPYSKWILTFAMLLGRLEIFTILVLFSPAFWHK